MQTIFNQFKEQFNGKSLNEITDLDDAVDWLSDEYGYCVESFEIEEE